MSSEPTVVLEPIAKERAQVLANLFQLYVHDFSQYVPIEVQPCGRFGVAIDDGWWTRDDHFPFFIQCGEKLSGFALVRRGSRITGAIDVMDVAEFFVIRGMRGKKVGTCAARALFASFPGRWEIRVRRTNVPAQKFWSRAIGAWTGRPAPSRSLSIESVDWEVFFVGSGG